VFQCFSVLVGVVFALMRINFWIRVGKNFITYVNDCFYLCTNKFYSFFLIVIQSCNGGLTVVLRELSFLYEMVMYGPRAFALDHSVLEYVYCICICTCTLNIYRKWSVCCSVVLCIYIFKNVYVIDLILYVYYSRHIWCATYIFSVLSPSFLVVLSTVFLCQ
jgi:hypothetical protein